MVVDRDGHCSVLYLVFLFLMKVLNYGFCIDFWVGRGRVSEYITKEGLGIVD